MRWHRHAARQKLDKSKMPINGCNTHAMGQGLAHKPTCMLLQAALELQQAFYGKHRTLTSSASCLRSARGSCAIGTSTAAAAGTILGVCRVVRGADVNRDAWVNQ
jgi:hypothetical protein